MSDATVSLRVDDRIARLTLNRPERLNSFNDTMLAELREALKRVQSQSDIRVLILTGEGEGFCAGQDLHALRDDPSKEMPDMGQILDRGLNPIVRILHTLSIPVVCAVNGVAAGAGVSLALMGDVVVAGRSARFVHSFSRVGLVPDGGGTWLLPRLVGHARAMALMLLGEELSAEQAADWGMIWKCVDDADLGNEVTAIAETLVARSPRSLDGIKRAVGAAASRKLDDQLDEERDLQRQLGRSEDFREGVAAFLEKRSPQFRNR